MAEDTAVTRTASWLKDAPLGDDKPRNDWAIVEIFGHIRRIGRIGEVELAGAKLLRVDVPYKPTAENPAGERVDVYTYGGAAIFSCRPISEAWAIRLIQEEEKHMWREEHFLLGSPAYDDPEDEIDGE